MIDSHFPSKCDPSYLFEHPGTRAKSVSIFACYKQSALSSCTRSRSITPTLLLQLELVHHCPLACNWMNLHSQQGIQLEHTSMTNNHHRSWWLKLVKQFCKLNIEPLIMPFSRHDSLCPSSSSPLFSPSPTSIRIHSQLVNNSFASKCSLLVLIVGLFLVCSPGLTSAQATDQTANGALTSSAPDVPCMSTPSPTAISIINNGRVKSKKTNRKQMAITATTNNSASVTDSAPKGRVNHANHNRKRTKNRKHKGTKQVITPDMSNVTLDHTCLMSDACLRDGKLSTCFKPHRPIHYDRDNRETEDFYDMLLESCPHFFDENGELSCLVVNGQVSIVLDPGARLACIVCVHWSGRTVDQSSIVAIDRWHASNWITAIRSSTIVEWHIIVVVVCTRSLLEGAAGKCGNVSRGWQAVRLGRLANNLPN